MDFMKVKTRVRKAKRDDPSVLEVYPDFVVCRSKDLMIKGGKFYAIWDEANSIWSTDEYEVQRLVDQALAEKAKDISGYDQLVVMKMSEFSTKSWSSFQNYVKNISDNWHQLDTCLTFKDDIVKKEDYVSHRLPYNLEDGDYSAWSELLSTLYSEEERDKIEWAIGAIVSGDSKEIQKFLVFFGAGGTGKSTILKIIGKLFDGYCAEFDAKSLGMNNSAFATETLKDNPLVAIQTDGDMSRIEDNTKINTIVAHESIIINEKFKSAYSMRLNTFMMLASNKPVKITDSKSGIIRRLIDIRPTGNRIPRKKYDTLMSKIGFELGAIAKHCLDKYRQMGKNYYDEYEPIDMMFRTDVFFNYVEEQYMIFSEEDGTSLKSAYAAYREYCEQSDIDERSRLPRYKFREELKDYFERFEDVTRIDGKQVRSYYSGFLKKKFNRKNEPVKETPLTLVLDKTESLLDILLKDCPAQYANENEAPTFKWENVRTTLKDLDTKQLHYVNVPEDMCLVVIDFDIRNDKGEKDMLLNLEAASKWPATYAEFSKGGSGVHLHYIWKGGDPKELSSVAGPGVEVKVFSGNSSLRRRVSFCNDIPVATLSSGLPRKEKKVVNREAIESEQGLRAFVKSCLQKKHHGATKPEIDFIFSKLEEAYASGMHYDLSDMRQSVLNFAMGSTHQAENCVKIVAKMHFASEDASKATDGYSDDRIVFYDVEVFPNLLLVNWKYDGVGEDCFRMINPTSEDIEFLMNKKLVGFNCRRYDNHILYARFMHQSNEEIYALSKRIIDGSKNAMYGEAYNLSYTDIYDFSSKKQSLKKWEIEMGFHHKELGLPWDQPVPEEKWVEVAEYCDNDVKATEALWHHKSIQADWTARKILAGLSGLSVNDTTNQHTTKIIFGGDKNPQRQFNYRFLGTEDGQTYSFFGEELGCDEYTSSDSKGRPCFPGYSFEHGKSVYRGEEVGEGGYVYAEPGMYGEVALLDIASMHPSSIVAEQLFGPTYTRRFQDILEARIAIKHRDFEKARSMLDGKLAPFLDDESKADELASALKIAVNSVYGLTSARFDNPFRDIRNKDNIVAKRGALFMVNLKHEVQKRGFKVAHIKTDSIKIPNATPEIIQFVMDYGKLYGYNFELESVYDRMCLVNDAVYIAHGKSGKHAGEWIATGAQFQQPFVYKRLFTHDPIRFPDLCETKSVSTALYLDFNENLPEGEHNRVFVGKVGLFCPIQPGKNGGLLVREKLMPDGTKNYYAVGGTKGYRWREAETIESAGLQDQIDVRYFIEQADQAKEDISSYGPWEWFVDPSLSDHDENSLSHSMCSIENCYICPYFHPMDSVEESEIYAGSCGLGYS